MERFFASYAFKEGANTGFGRTTIDISTSPQNSDHLAGIEVAIKAKHFADRADVNIVLINFFPMGFAPV